MIETRLQQNSQIFKASLILTQWVVILIGIQKIGAMTWRLIFQFKLWNMALAHLSLTYKIRTITSSIWLYRMWSSPKSTRGPQKTQRFQILTQQLSVLRIDKEIKL